METGKGRGYKVNASGGAASGSNRVNRYGILHGLCRANILLAGLALGVSDKALSLQPPAFTTCSFPLY